MQVKRINPKTNLMAPSQELHVCNLCCDRMRWPLTQTKRKISDDYEEFNTQIQANHP
jgi:hypothetical protein